jgi:DNA (cytosine-5)-methyltransferase 1
MKTTREMLYPDMKLYQEILFLQHYFDGKYCVENVIPFYEPLIAAQKRGRHLYWTNFNLPTILTERKNPDLSRTKNLISVLSKFHDYNFRDYNGEQPMNKIARNLVDYEAGKTILDTALGIYEANNKQQTKLF